MHELFLFAVEHFVGLGQSCFEVVVVLGEGLHEGFELKFFPDDLLDMLEFELGKRVVVAHLLEDLVGFEFEDGVFESGFERQKRARLCHNI